MKNKLFSALFLSITMLAACGDNTPAEEPAAESTATPAVVSAAPAPAVDVVATKCFDVGSDGVLHVTGKVRFDGPVGINADPVDGTGLTTHGETTGVHASGNRYGVSGDSLAGGSGVYGKSSVGSGVGVEGNGATSGVSGTSAIYGVQGVSLAGGVGVNGTSLYPEGTGIQGNGSLYGVYAVGVGTPSTGLYANSMSADVNKASDPHVLALEALVKQMQVRIDALEAHQQP